MPKLQKLYSLEVTPQQFINACDDTELQELDLLLNAKLHHRADIKNIEIIEPKHVGPSTGHNGDWKRCALCGFFKKL